MGERLTPQDLANAVGRLPRRFFELLLTAYLRRLERRGPRETDGGWIAQTDKRTMYHYVLKLSYKPEGDPRAEEVIFKVLLAADIASFRTDLSYIPEEAQAALMHVMRLGEFAATIHGRNTNSSRREGDQEEHRYTDSTYAEGAPPASAATITWANSQLPPPAPWATHSDVGMNRPLLQNVEVNRRGGSLQEVRRLSDSARSNSSRGTNSRTRMVQPRCDEEEQAETRSVGGSSGVSISRIGQLPSLFRPSADGSNPYWDPTVQEPYPGYFRGRILKDEHIPDHMMSLSDHSNSPKPSIRPESELAEVGQSNNQAARRRPYDPSAMLGDVFNRFDIGPSEPGPSQPRDGSRALHPDQIFGMNLVNAELEDEEGAEQTSGSRQLTWHEELEQDFVCDPRSGWTRRAQDPKGKGKGKGKGKERRH